MAVGKMRNTVTFRKNTPAAAGAGFADSYTDLLTTRGHLKRASQGRDFSFGAIVDNEIANRYIRGAFAI